MSDEKKADSLDEAIEQLNDQQADGADESATEKDENSELAAELEKAKKDYLYLRADFDNFKKAAIKERSDLVKFGSERLVMELLGVLDTFDQALAMDISADNLESFKKGVEMIRSELNSALSRFGVAAIEVKGEAFDPTMHEALSAEPTDAVPAGHISQVFKKAYKMHDRVIRPAQVVVAKEPEESASEGNE